MSPLRAGVGVGFLHRGGSKAIREFGIGKSEVRFGSMREK